MMELAATMLFASLRIDSIATATFWFVAAVLFAPPVEEYIRETDVVSSLGI